jgi:hypothetical protein
MKIGNLNFKNAAASKPIAISPAGKFLTVADLKDQPSLALGSRFSLSKGDQLKLALERYRLEPDFKLGVIGAGIMTKREIVDEMKAQTEFGQMALGAEMVYCNELAESLGSAKLPAWPKPLKPAAPLPPAWKPVKKCINLRLATRVVFCENTTDNVTKTFAAYRIANVHAAFQARGFKVISLVGTDDVRSNFITEAKNGLTVYLGGIGHGAYTLYTGNQGNHILEVGQYDPAEVTGKGCHYLSCQTARQLGPDVVAHGGRFYAGYDENFTFVWDDSATPIDEVLLFKKCDSMFDITIANGGTAQLAFNATVQAFNSAIAQVPNTAAATWLTWDRNHLKLLGAGASTISPSRYVRVCYPIMDRNAETALAMAGTLLD